MVQLARFTDGTLQGRLRQIGESWGLENVFNPSVMTLDGIVHIAFRARPKGDRGKFRAYFLPGMDVAGASLIDLSSLAVQRGLAPTADPKLVRLGNRIFVTYNTGHWVQPNSVVLQQLVPTIGSPQVCHILDRQPVEKNWSFYLSSEEQLCALYSLEPLRSIQLVNGDLGSSEDLYFESVEGGLGPTSTAITIGTQPAPMPDGRLIVVAHRKIAVAGKRLYFGVPVSIDVSREKIAAQVSSVRLIHSWRALFPPRTRHNRDLISATYFSGIDVRGRDVILSYGINDLSFGFAVLPMESLWR